MTACAIPCLIRSAPRWCAPLLGQLEQVLALLSEVVGLVRVGVSGLIPLVRMSQQALTVESLSTLHYRALGESGVLRRSGLDS